MSAQSIAWFGPVGQAFLDQHHRIKEAESIFRDERQHWMQSMAAYLDEVLARTSLTYTRPGAKVVPGDTRQELFFEIDGALKPRLGSTTGGWQEGVQIISSTQPDKSVDGLQRLIFKTGVAFRLPNKPGAGWADRNGALWQHLSGPEGKRVPLSHLYVEGNELQLRFAHLRSDKGEITMAAVMAALEALPDCFKRVEGWLEKHL